MARNIIFVQGDNWDIHDNQVVNILGERGAFRASEASRDWQWAEYAEVPELASGDSEYSEYSEDSEAPEVVLTEEQWRIRRAVEVLRKEGVLRFGYDLAWVMLVLNQTDGWPSFHSTVSFLQYLRATGLEDLPNEDSITRKVSRTRHAHPNWTFQDTTDATETLRRNHVASRFLHCLRTGQHIDI